MNKFLRSIVVITSLFTVPAVQAKTFSLTVVNKTSSIVEAVYASPTGEDDWEEDLLGDKAINIGGRYTVRFKDDREVCRYDLRFEFRDTNFEPLEDTQNLCEIEEYELTE